MLANKRKNQNRVNKIILAMKQARMNQGITRYQLSKDTGLSDSSISNIEQLKQNPTLSTLIEMSASINFDLTQALKENYPYSSDDVEELSENIDNKEDETLALSPTFFLITDALKSMSEEKLKVVYSVIKGLNEK